MKACLLLKEDVHVMKCVLRLDSYVHTDKKYG